MVNYILTRHGWPMIVVRSKNKQEYLEALRQTDVIVGAAPPVGARATVMQIGYFLKYFKNLMAGEIQADIDFVIRKEVDVWWYDGEMITARSKNTAKALRAMREKPVHHLCGVGFSASHQPVCRAEACEANGGARLHCASGRFLEGDCDQHCLSSRSESPQEKTPTRAAM